MSKPPNLCFGCAEALPEGESYTTTEYAVAEAAKLEAEIIRLHSGLDELRAALQGLYDFLPRYSCKSNTPDGCPVCVARAALRGGRGEHT